MYDYFEKLTPRQQLNDLIHKYAQTRGVPYNSAWSDFDKAWAVEYGKTLSLRRALEQRVAGRKITLPEYVEKAGLMDMALELAHSLIDNRVKNWLIKQKSSQLDECTSGEATV